MIWPLHLAIFILGVAIGAALALVVVASLARSRITRSGAPACSHTRRRASARAADVVVLADSREALVTARVETRRGPLAAMLEVVIAPSPALDGGSTTAWMSTP